MDRVGRGLIAGFIATLAMSALHDPILMLTAAIGLKTPTIGWLFHFFVGTMLWGGIFGLLHDTMRGPSWLRGLTFAAGVSLLVLFVVMPIAGVSILGLKLGIATPIAIVAFHLIYGAMLGALYGQIAAPSVDVHRNGGIGRPAR